MVLRDGYAQLLLWRVLRLTKHPECRSGAMGVARGSDEADHGVANAVAANVEPRNGPQDRCPQRPDRKRALTRRHPRDDARKGHSRWSEGPLREGLELGGTVGAVAGEIA